MAEGPSAPCPPLPGPGWDCGALSPVSAVPPRWRGDVLCQMSHHPVEEEGVAPDPEVPQGSSLGPRERLVARACCPGSQCRCAHSLGNWPCIHWSQGRPQSRARARRAQEHSPRGRKARKWCVRRDGSRSLGVPLELRCPHGEWSWARRFCGPACLKGHSKGQRPSRVWAKSKCPRCSPSFPGGLDRDASPLRPKRLSQPGRE